MPIVTALLRDESGDMREVAIAEDSWGVGRSSENEIVLSDRGVSRRHAQLEWRDGELWLRHLRANNATYVNGEMVPGVARLADGDRIRMSRSWLLVRFGDLREGDRELLDYEALDAEPLEITMALPALDKPSTRNVHGASLSMLSELGDTLRSLTQLDDILTVLLGAVFDLVAPERGVVLLREAEGGGLRSVVAHPEDADRNFSRSVLRHAIEQRETLVVADVARDLRFADAESLRQGGVRSAICCPLIARGEVLGALYLDMASAWSRSRESELGLLNLIACYAAAAIDSALLLRDLGSSRVASELDAEPIVARSKAMTDALACAERLAPGSNPVLIEGEAGTGKLLMARRLHLRSRRAEGPFLTLDCRQLSGRELRALLEGDDGRAGIWDRAVRGTLVIEHVGALDLLAQQFLLELLQSSAADESAPRLVATSSSGMKKLSSDQGFSTRLAELLQRETLRLPRLRERVEDIEPLADHFLALCAREQRRPAKRLSPAASKILLAGKYREGNVSELRRTMQLAALLAEGDEIESEQIFTGVTKRNHRFEIELGASAPLRWLARRGVQRSLQAIVAAIFLAIMGLCLFAAERSGGRAANAVIWGLWWPGLLLLFVLVGRLWCTWCPVSSLATRLQSLWNRGAKPAQWIKDNGSWLTAGLFLAIVWSEHVFAMPEQPQATGWFLLSLTTMGTLFALWMPREVWCRFACPLGNLSACYSVAGTVHVHANPAICSTQCKTHECHKGSAEEAGCPMFLHPLYLKDAHYCKLCLGCVRNCPNDSARLWFRPPLQDLWSLGEVNPSLMPISLVVVLLAPLLLATHRHFALTENPLIFTIASVGLATLSIPLVRLLPRWLAADRDRQLATRVVLALLLLAWGPFLAFHLAHVPGLAGLTVRSATALAAGELSQGSGLALLPLLQGFSIVLALLLALGVLYRLRTLVRGQGAPRGAWPTLFAFVFLYAALSLVLVI